MDARLNYYDQGRYDLITAVGEVQGAQFVDLYQSIFTRRASQAKTYFLIDIRRHPSMLDVAGFREILKSAEAAGIEKINMFVVSFDPSRPAVGRMFEALCVEFSVNVDIKFFTDFSIAKNAVRKETQM